MAPIHDTDIAEERWSQAEWRHVEFWEKIEQRIRKKKRVWIMLTVIVFMILSSIPVLMNRWAKWTSLTLVRRLGTEVNLVKRLAATEHVAYRIRFVEDGSLNYVVEKMNRCGDSKVTRVREGSIAKGPNDKVFRLVRSRDASALGIPGLVNSFCFDFLSGSSVYDKTNDFTGFGVIHVKDLAEKRTDRLSVLFLKGKSAETSFD